MKKIAKNIKKLIKINILTNQITNFFTKKENMVKIQNIVRAKPKGLVNTGNNCFVNSTIQCIIQHPKIISFFAQHNFHSNQANSEAFKEFILNYKNSPENASPNNFIGQLRGRMSILDGRMQDAYEFLILFLDLIINEQVDEPKIISKAFLKEFEKQQILRLFAGMQVIKSVCSVCHYEQSKCELFRSIILYGELTTVDEMIQKYFHPSETLSCQKCDTRTSKNIKSDILFMPEILTIVVSRFIGNTEKNNKRIVIEPTLKIENYKYELYGIVNHRGSLDSGHYTSCVKINKEWMLFDDDMVSSVQPDFNSSTAYFLFYTRTLF